MRAMIGDKCAAVITMMTSLALNDRDCQDISWTDSILTSYLPRSAGDAKLEAEGKSEKAAGKIQNAVGGIKDAVMRHQQPAATSLL
jgi:hypothetical protein